MLIGNMRFVTILGFIVVVFSVLFTNCAPSKNDGGGAGGPPNSAQGSYVWSNIGPKGGYVSSLSFHPNQAGVVWAAGDDSDGIYKSTDYGATWTLLTNTPPNQSSFSFLIDPSQPNRLYVPNHYGRGMLMSLDGGANWTLNQAGLPFVGEHKRVYALTVNPTNTDLLIAATDDGLYRSQNAGVSFSKLSINWGTAFGAAIFANDGRLYAGALDTAAKGALKYSLDNGNTWGNVFPAGGVAISKLAVTTTSLYILYESAELIYLLHNFSDSGTLNSASTGVTTGLRTALAVKSGATQAADILYFGTSVKAGVAANRWGLFKSTNGGANFTQMSGNISGVSIFSIAIDPQNSNNIVVGTVGEGIFHTRNAGSTWVTSNNDVYANSGLSLAQNSSNPNQIIFSSSTGSGLGRNYVTNDGGVTWAQFAHANSSDGESTFEIDPTNANNILAGTFASGIYRSTGGTAGSWVRVLNKDIKIDKIIRNKVNSQVVYALAIGPNPGTNADATLYYSGNSGASFDARPSTFANDLALHPTNAEEAVIAGFGDAFVSTNFFVNKTGLGLSSYALQEDGAFSAAAFDPQAPATLLVGGAKGGLYKTTNYNSSGAGISWTKLTTPIQNVVIRNIAIIKRGSVTHYYVATFGADVFFSPTTTAGLFRSSDGGVTWKSLSDGLFPCTVFWHFFPYAQTDNTFLGGMWGGGLMKLVDTE